MLFAGGSLEVRVLMPVLNLLLVYICCRFPTDPELTLVLVIGPEWHLGYLW